MIDWFKNLYFKLFIKRKVNEYATYISKAEQANRERKTKSSMNDEVISRTRVYDFKSPSVEGELHKSFIERLRAKEPEYFENKER